MPTVEVVLCTYNGARFIEAQLRSILEQRRRVDRLSIYDDGSTDDTVAIARATIAAHRDPALDATVSVNPRNLGYARNFGEALARATADYVAFSDQDDIWEPDKIERLLAAAERGRASLVFSDGIPIDADGVPFGGPSVLRGYGVSAASAASFARDAWAILLRRNVINGMAAMVRRETAQDALPIPPEFPHDYWLALWLARSGPIVCIDEPLYRYRLHDSNTIGISREPWHRQLYSIWRTPLAPRLQDLRRTRALLARLPSGDPRASEVRRKLDWLQSVCERPDRLHRFGTALRGLIAGEYRRFAAPHAFLRDVVGALRGAGDPRQ